MYHLHYSGADVVGGKQRRRHDRAADGIHAKVQLPPGPAPSGAMFLAQRFARTAVPSTCRGCALSAPLMLLNVAVARPASMNDD